MSKAEDYLNYISKFEKKLTTDDTFTPPAVYEVVQRWVCNRYGIEESKIVRPFYPDGDYRSEDYNDKIVVDNPPFSILGQIIDYYKSVGVKFFLFAPGLSSFHYLKKNISVVCTYTTLAYDNGAKICTSFLTNLEPEPAVFTSKELKDDLEETQQKKKNCIQNIYPRGCYTASHLSIASDKGVDVYIKYSKDDVVKAMRDEEGNEVQMYGAAILVRDNDLIDRIDAAIISPYRYYKGEKIKVKRRLTL